MTYSTSTKKIRKVNSLTDKKFSKKTLPYINSNCCGIAVATDKSRISEPRKLLIHNRNYLSPKIFINQKFHESLKDHIINYVKEHEVCDLDELDKFGRNAIHYVVIRALKTKLRIRKLIQTINLLSKNGNSKLFMHEKSFLIIT